MIYKCVIERLGLRHPSLSKGRERTVAEFLKHGFFSEIALPNFRNSDNVKSKNISLFYSISC